MAIILGTDTGGTYTDSVIFDTAAGKILCKSKAFTTREDLSTGISDSIKQLEFPKMSEISEVHLSTTLATNSILENITYSIGVVLIGRDIKGKLLCSQKHLIKTRDFCSDRSAAFSLKDSSIQNIREKFSSSSEKCINVSYYGAKNNPELETAAAEYLAELTGKPVFSAWEITKTPGHKRRTNTAILNKALQPVIQEWLRSMNTVLIDNNIAAPVYIMTGAGSLITEEEAVAHPEETLMSGPAASAAGAMFLCHENDALLIDMGGTSADVTKLEKGRFRMNRHSTTVRDIEIAAKTLDIQSFAVGGDSHIFYNQVGTLRIGPRKVVPLCVAASSYPHLVYELETYKKPPDYEMFTAYSTDCYLPGYRKGLTRLTDFEKRVVKMITLKPHSLFYLSYHFNVDPDTLHLGDLAERGYVRRASFTPTDLLHITGRYRQWDPAVCHTAARIMCRLGGYEMNDFLDRCEKLVVDNLVFSCMQSIANFEDIRFDFRKSEGTMYLIRKYLDYKNPYLSAGFRITKPLISVGAPACSWMQHVADKLGTELILPDDHDVANAIGAAISVYGKNTEGF